MIKLTDTQVDILGRPNFHCMKVAKILIAAGDYEDKAKKAEYEQAVFIHWAYELFAVHGDNWQEEGEKILQDAAKRVQAKLKANA